MQVLNGFKKSCPKRLTFSHLFATILLPMKHMIKWLKITAGINLYLSIIMTLVFLTLIFAVTSDYNLTNADEYINFIIEKNLEERDQ